ncbi:MAG: protein YgfX [Halomonas sp.]|uniref:protein YgfX n=1 Tax=Halomonas sp. TaxID=1486246 RepID=UPI002ACDE2D5|nr:protein YgfX [Halomonas sp.]MDZ7853154.1 protein YgfX [Halomonas sp.]
MPRPQTTIAIVTSRLSLAAHGLLAVSVVGLMAVVASPWAGMLAALVLGGVLLTLARYCPRGELRGTPKAAGGVVWSWRDSADQAWRPVSLRCDYLGPWLIGLKVEGRRLWLWPDSSDAESLRRLRRELSPLP